MWINFIDDLFSVVFFRAFVDLFTFMFLSSTDTTTKTERFLCHKRKTHVADIKCRLDMFRCPTVPYSVMRDVHCVEEEQHIRLWHRIAALEKRPNWYRYEWIHAFFYRLMKDKFLLVFEIHERPKKHPKVDFDIVRMRCLSLMGSDACHTTLHSPQSPRWRSHETRTAKSKKKRKNTDRIFIKMCHGWDLHFCGDRDEEDSNLGASNSSHRLTVYHMWMWTRSD